MADKFQVNPKLVEMVDKLLEEASGAGKKGAAALTLEEKLKVLDRGLKLEMIRAKIKDEDYGSGFGD